MILVVNHTKFVCRLLGGSAAADASRLASNYLCAVAYGSAVPHLSGDAAKLAFSKLWSSLEVTFLYENYLLELRHVAFEGKSHMREPQLSEFKAAEDVDACIEAVEATVIMSGWPSIPQSVLQVECQAWNDDFHTRHC
ncbi:MAG: hypothetical protein FRX49_13827 [Trebouxia sp. A1-2]|nr:MAG: hypothetical protein FRX49_13827 [Trebouxia sp. A1-2]